MRRFLACLPPSAICWRASQASERAEGGTPMTEAEWLDGRSTPAEMLAWVRGKASDRKLRLFIVGCCRRWRIETEIPDQKSWDAVHVAEWYADGNGSEKNL